MLVVFYLDIQRHVETRITVGDTQKGGWKGYGDMGASYWHSLRISAGKRDLPFEVTMKYLWEIYLKQERKCIFTGLNIAFDRGSRGTASLDRIDSSKGYIVGNVQWVHKDINKIKGKFLDK